MNISEMETLSHWNLNDGKPVIENKDKKDFYNDAAQYWSNIPPTVDGMLGGYGHISTVDIQGSSQFLKQLFRLKVPPGKGRALDCGAGIGRITKNLLLNHFQKVDLVEQNPAFVSQARVALENLKNMGNFFCSGLQDFTPEPATYDVIWCQWVLGHLTDDDLISFLNDCICGLKMNGVIVLKENTTTNNQMDVDATDSSVTRPLEMLCELLQRAGLRCVRQKRQVNFPHGLYPVYMIATRPNLESLPKGSSLGFESIEGVCGEPSTSVNVKTDSGSNSGCKAEKMSALPGGIPELRTNSGKNLVVAECADQAVTSNGSIVSQNVPKQQDNEEVCHSGSNLPNTALPLLASAAAYLGTAEKDYLNSGGSRSEPFEQEATGFSREVEYSSDDSTKTEMSTADICDPIENISVSEPSISNLRNARYCDIA